jgi:type IV pilus assembly protein PilV
MILRHDDQRGFGVLEVLVSITLFAVVAAALAASTIGGMKANYTSKHVATASALIYSKIEALRSLNPGAADMTAGQHVDPLNPMTSLGANTGPSNDRMYSRSWTVTANSPRPGLSKVVVTVSWNNPDPAAVQAITYICSSAACVI